MSDSLPWSIFGATAIFIGFLNTHQRHVARFQGSSQLYLFALLVSVTLGTLVGLALFVYYFLAVGWFWTVILFFGGSLVAGILFGTFGNILGLLAMSLISFLGWPIAALLMYFLIRDLPR